MNNHEKHIQELLHLLKIPLQNAIAYSCARLNIDSLSIFPPEFFGTLEESLVYKGDNCVSLEILDFKDIIDMVSSGCFPDGSEWAPIESQYKKIKVCVQGTNQEILFSTFKISDDEDNFFKKSQYMQSAERLGELFFDSKDRGFEINENNKRLYILDMMNLLSPLCEIKWYYQEDCKKIFMKLAIAYAEGIDLPSDSQNQQD